MDNELRAGRIVAAHYNVMPNVRVRLPRRVTAAVMPHKARCELRLVNQRYRQPFALQ